MLICLVSLFHQPRVTLENKENVGRMNFDHLLVPDLYLFFFMRITVNRYRSYCYKSLKIPKGKNRQHNGQKKKDKQQSTKHIHKTKDRATRTPLKTGRKFMCSRRVSSSCSNSSTHRVTFSLAINAVLDILSLCCVVFCFSSSCVWFRIVVSNAYCVVILFCVSSSCVHYMASFSGLYVFYCPLCVF
jgi:hypothetical protein